MQTRLAAIISDTIYLYAAECAPAIDAALDVLRDDRKPGSGARFIAAIKAAGASEATEEEAEGFPTPAEGDALHLPFPG